MKNLKNHEWPTFGNRELSVWRVAPGVCWIQSRDPKHARKLSSRTDSRLVAWGVAGGYHRTFEFPHGLAWARRLIDRYTLCEALANEPLTVLASPTAHPKAKLLSPEGVGV